jgi:putative Holliday junction resolvase
VNRREPLGRVLGLDPGERRVGVALSDAGGIIAQPHEVIDRRVEDVGDRIQAIVAEYEVGRIVVGLPVSLSGHEGPAADTARAFGCQVAVQTARVVEFADERFTTVTAERALLESGLKRKKRRDVRDKVAAAVMLQAFLDHEHHHDVQH